MIENSKISHSLMDSSVGEEADLQLLNALQIAPRAPWAKIASIIGGSAVTLARRWNRLSDNGDAWISAYTTNREAGGALVEIDCEANFSERVALALSADARALTIEETSGARDLLVSVIADSARDLSEFLRQVQLVPGVRSARTHVITGIVKDAGHWRLGALEPAKVEALQRLNQRTSGSSHAVDGLSKRILAALSTDGRMPVVDLADQLSVSVNTIRRRMALLESSGWLRLRCDVTRAVSGFALAATIWVIAPPVELQDVASALATIPEVRAVFTVTGPSNLAVVVWLRHPENLPELEVQFARRAPNAQISDRVVTLRTVKHVGRVLDKNGRAMSVVAWGDRTF